MSLNKEQEDEVRKQVVAQFGEECVKRMDALYVELNDLRASSVSSYDFLERVKNKYSNENTDLVLAGLLFGMKMGEMATEARLKIAELEAEMKGKLEAKQKKESPEEEEKRKKLEAEWQAADERRKEFSFERDYQ